MRSIKELLELMLDNKDLFNTGLCDWTLKLYLLDIISDEECYLLRQYIISNRPSLYNNFRMFYHTILRDDPESHFYWKRGDIKPRIKWIKKHIAKNS